MGNIFQEMLRQEVLSGGTADVVGFYLFLPWWFWYLITDNSIILVLLMIS